MTGMLLHAPKIKVKQISNLKFSARRGFSFLCNRDLQNGWTPTRLFDERGISNTGQMRFVVIQMTTENFDHVLELIENWHEIGLPVHITFPSFQKRPAVGDESDHLFYGLDIEDCYLPSDHGFTATDKLKDLVASLLHDPTITIDD